MRSFLPSPEKSAAKTTVAPPWNVIEVGVDDRPPPDTPFHSRRRLVAVVQQLGAPAMRSRKPSPSTSSYANTGRRALVGKPMSVMSVDANVKCGAFAHGSIDVVSVVTGNGDCSVQ